MPSYNQHRDGGIVSGAIAAGLICPTIPSVIVGGIAGGASSYVSDFLESPGEIKPNGKRVGPDHRRYFHSVTFGASLISLLMLIGRRR